MNTVTNRLLIGTLALIPTATLAQSRPNIIIILADDMGYGDWGCYGNRDHATPNIDAMAQSGMKFTDFNTNGAVSSPTRASIMTGMYPQAVGIEGVVKAASDRDKGLDTSNVTIAKLLKANGYETAIYGKWHLGYAPKYNPINHGFDHFVGYVSGNVDYFSHIDMAGYEDWWHQDKLHPEEGYTTELITDYAVRFLEGERNDPFFLYIPYEACHSPYQGPDDAPIRKIVDGKVHNIKQVNKRDPKETYSLMTKSLDDNVGRIMKSLKDSGLEKNTLVLLFSDNGGANNSCNDPWSGKKGTPYEGGHRVSSIAYWPKKIKGGSTCDETIISMDLLPTLCRLTSTPLGEKIYDGIDVTGAIFKKKQLPERTLFWRQDKDVAVRCGDWKMIINRKTKQSRLFNLSTDVKEKIDLSGDNPEITKGLMSQLADWEARYRTK